MLQFTQKNVESYFKSYSSTIFMMDGQNNKNIDIFHSHVLVRWKNDLNDFYNIIDRYQYLENVYLHNKLNATKEEVDDKVNYKLDDIYGKLVYFDLEKTYKSSKSFELASLLVEKIQEHITKQISS